MFTSPPPALFVPHGAPTFVLHPGAAGHALAAYAASMPLPRAVVVVSAHWETTRPAVGSALRPRTVHDFHGFPQELYSLAYPATGCPEVARAVADRLAAAGLTTDLDPEHGLDHGAWVPLRLMYPDAQVPVVPLSVQPAFGPAHALAVGRALAPLRTQGVLVLASGSLTHNLRDYVASVRTGTPTPAYVREFADWVWARLESGDEATLLDWRRRAPSAARAHPTDEHLLPLFVALGAGGLPASRWYAGIDERVLAMDAFAFGAPRPRLQ